METTKTAAEQIAFKYNGPQFQNLRRDIQAAIDEAVREATEAGSCDVCSDGLGHDGGRIYHLCDTCFEEGPGRIGGGA